MAAGGGEQFKMSLACCQVGNDFLRRPVFEGKHAGGEAPRIGRVVCAGRRRVRRSGHRRLGRTESDERAGVLIDRLNGDGLPGFFDVALQRHGVGGIAGGAA